MAEIIPSYTISDFKKLKVAEIRRLKSCEIISDGDYLFTFINPATPFIRKQAEYKAELSNSVSGETMEDILKKEVVNV